MDVFTDALSSSPLLSSPIWDSADRFSSHSSPDQYALECQNQSPEETCFSRYLFDHDDHHGFRHHSRGCSQHLQPSARPNMAVYVELSRADCG